MFYSKCNHIKCFARLEVYYFNTFKRLKNSQSNLDEIRDTWNTHRLQSNDNGIGGGKRPILIYTHSTEDWESEFEGSQEQVKCCPACSRLEVIAAHWHPTRMSMRLDFSSLTD